jgi:hypothetical protein
MPGPSTPDRGSGHGPGDHRHLSRIRKLQAGQPSDDTWDQATERVHVVLTAFRTMAWAVRTPARRAVPLATSPENQGMLPQREERMRPGPL